MPLFFMLSGAVLALSPDVAFDKFFKSKVKRLLIPYFIYGWLFMLPVKRLGNFYNNASFKDALKGFLSGLDSGHLWFLTALFWCMIIFVINKKIMEKLGIGSIYAILLLCGLIQMTVSYIPLDVIGLKSGLGYIFYFAMGYVFECERRSCKKWNMRTTVFTLTFILFIEVINFKLGILNSFFTIIAGSFLIYLLSDICDRCFKNINERKFWNIVIKNLFYVYLFHDPLEYIVLRLFMERNWLSYGFGCIAYTFSRTVLIFIICICLGEIMYKVKNYIEMSINK
jgi:fucose 4-O-acetylase-like acetyltransferase